MCVACVNECVCVACVHEKESACKRVISERDFACVNVCAWNVGYGPMGSLFVE